MGGEAPEGEVGELAEAGDTDGAVGELELHGLERSDGLAELDAPVDVLHRQLHRSIARAEHGRRRERGVEQHVAIGAGHVGARRRRAARREVDHERTEARAEGSGGRPGQHGRTGEGCDDPLVEQIAVVDPRGAVGHGGERSSLGITEEHGGHRVGEGHPTGRLAEGGGRRQRIGVVPRIEVVDPERVERAGHLSGAAGRVVLGPAGRVDAAERRERLRRRRAELDGLLGQQRVHVLDPLSRALDTIMRCTSIVPDDTVAAWA